MKWIGWCYTADMETLLFNLSAFVSLIPAALYPHVRRGTPDSDPRGGPFWAVLAVAIAGSASWCWTRLDAGWDGGFSVTLWVTIAVSLLIFTALSLYSEGVARLLALCAGYLAVLGALATIWAGAEPGTEMGQDLRPATWLNLHIVVSVLTYALFTLAAVAALAVMLQERALKRHRPTRFTRMLPAVAEGERLQRYLLDASAIVLGIGLLTGLAIGIFGAGAGAEAVLPVTHKTLFSIFAFVVIAGLALVDRFSGVAGRRAARWLLLAYLLMTLGYPGVRFVSTVMLA